MQRKDEILAKKAKLAELRRQREEREQRQKEHGKRESILDDSSDVKAPTPTRSTDRKELDSFIETLVGDRPGSRGPGTPSSAGRKSRPSSTFSTVQIGAETYDHAQSSTSTAVPVQTASVATQTLSTGPVETAFDQAPAPTLPSSEVLTYSKAIQTSELWSPPRRRKSRGGALDSDTDDSLSNARSPTASKRLSRRQREREEELRQNLRREIEEELKAAKDLTLNGAASSTALNFPARGLSNEELNAVTSSDEFLDFVEKSSKVIEKALDQDYDVLADYGLEGAEVDEDEDEGYGSSRSKKGRRIRQIGQFYDERWSKKRMISDMGFSPKVRQSFPM